MAGETQTLLQVAETSLSAQQAEVAAEQKRQLQAVVTKFDSATGDIDHTFVLDRRFRLTFVRCHFSGGTGSAAMTISVDSTLGSAYDTLLQTIATAGTGNDVHFRIPASEQLEPSPWTFQAGDKIKVQWTNPDSGNMIWGLEIGLALAS